MESSAPQVSIVLPVYNEEQALPEVLAQVRPVMDRSGYSYEILVVDDGSTDRSQAIALEQGARVFAHPTNRGNGAARLTGVYHARGEFIVMLDADGTYPAEKIPELLSYMNRADLVVGDRELEAGTVRWLRKPVKSFIRRLASYVTGSKIYDLNSGMRVFRRETILKFFNILPNTHSWVSTQVIAYLSNGLNVKYIPIAYHPRIGRSTFHPVRDTWNYLSLVFRTVMYFRPLKVFFPIATVIFAGGWLKFGYESWFLHTRIRESDVILITIGLVMGVFGLLADLLVRMNKPMVRPYMTEVQPETSRKDAKTAKSAKSAK